VWQPYHPDLAYYGDRADGLLAGARDGTPAAVRLFARHGAPQDATGARRVVAAEHGCASWDALEKRVAGLAGAPFARAYRAIEAHDPDGLGIVLAAHPEVAHQEGTNGNDLLGMAVATYDERTVGLMLGAGADPSHPNAHGWTPLHQVAYADAVHLAPLLLEARADPGASGRGDGGTPLVAALFWGNRRVADLLTAAAGVLPRNLRAAAGAGDAALAGDLLGTDGAGAHRGFYRPHSGFPEWSPSGDPQEVLDEALAYAARNDRPETVALLARAGARLEADVYRGTALTWAAATGAAGAARTLLSLGAEVDGRSSFGGESHGRDVTPLHIAAQSGHADVAVLLLDAGADPAARDGHGYGTPDGWAEHGGHPRLAERIRSHARRATRDPG